ISPQDYDLIRLRTAIQKDPGKDWSVPKMADMLRVSPGYVQNLYKKAFGIASTEDVSNSRIRFAQESVSYSKQTISAMAARCGYQHAEHFSRQFKRMTGVTPRDFQKRAQEQRTVR